jgi:hypothetical protein
LVAGPFLEHPAVPLDVLDAVAAAIVRVLRLRQDGRSRGARTLAMSCHVVDLDEDAIDDVWDP